MILCKYDCGKEGKYQLKDGSWICEKSSNSCPTMKKKNSNGLLLSIQKNGRKRRKGYKWKKSYPHKGKTYEEIYGIEGAKEQKLKLSNALKGKKGHPCTVEQKQNLSIKMKKYGGYRIGSGKGKHGWYKGFWCDSSYELAYVIYCLEHDIQIERNHKKFPYNYNGEVHHYIPDFIVEGKYVEIKGWMRKNDKEKIKQFPEELHVIIQPEIDHILDYAKEKYGKNFIELYDNSKKIKTRMLLKKEKTIVEKYDLCICGNKKHIHSNKCKKCAQYNFININKHRKQIKKIEWPNDSKLQEIVDNFGFLKTGKILGVSDNAIRKHIKIARKSTEVDTTERS